MEFITGNRIKVVPPNKIKKITGTKLAQILGIGTSGAYNTPFQCWCDMMGVYKKPFEESKYMIAGNFIEPKQADYVRNKYGLTNLLSRVDKYGPAADKQSDFYPLEKIFGGKWDYQIVNNDEQRSCRRVVECKTAQASKRDKWADGKVPADYYLQLGLYCWLEKINKGTFIVSFLNPYEYDNPAAFVPNADNTIEVPVEFDMNLFENEYIIPAQKWYLDHCVSGVSPQYNEIIEGDITIIKELQKKIAQENAKAETPAPGVETFYTKDIVTPFD